MRAIDNTQDIMDSRDIVERIKELEADKELASEEPATYAFSEDEQAELDSLQAVVAELEQYGDDKPEDGITLIRDSYFEDYAQELAEEIGAISKDRTWPNYCIDWERAARELQMDYTSLEFDGVTYWYR